MQSLLVRLIAVGLVVVAPGISFAQPTWARAYGDISSEGATAVAPTSDGGYAIAGYIFAGQSDAWVLKLGPNGEREWTKRYGGDRGEHPHAIIPIAIDGGYVLAGETSSFGAGDGDGWVVYLDAEGAVQWEMAYGGPQRDRVFSIQATSSGGWVVAGVTASFGRGGDDAWVLKLDGQGAVQWSKTYGGTRDESFNTIRQTLDGGYIVTGSTDSFGAGDVDAWMVKLAANGDVEWQKTYGGAQTDIANDFKQTSDGGYIVAGWTRSAGRGQGDFWLIKLDRDGAVQWQGAFGLADTEIARSVTIAPDGSYVVAGWTSSVGAGRSDVLVMKVDPTSRIEWDNAYGGTEPDLPEAVLAVNDGFVVVGRTDSFHDVGAGDAWVLRLDREGNIDRNCPVRRRAGMIFTGTALPSADSTATVRSDAVTTTGSSTQSADINLPVRAQCPVCFDKLWAKSYGGAAQDIATDISPDGRVVVGSTESFGADAGDVWILGVNGDGGLRFQKRLNMTTRVLNRAHAISPDGYGVAGTTGTTETTGGDAWILKLRDGGTIHWQLTVEGPGTQHLEVDETWQGDYVAAGGSQRDAWVFAVDPTGRLRWQIRYGGPHIEAARAIARMSDGAFVVAAILARGTESEAWLFKVDTDGELIWQKTYGGARNESVQALAATPDGGIIAVGYTESAGAGAQDAWVFKLDATGNVEWSKTYGGREYDLANDVARTNDGGYIVAGFTQSSGAGSFDAWVLRLDAQGGIVWQKTYGGPRSEMATSVAATWDGYFVVAGHTRSFGAGSADVWILRMDRNGNIGNNCSVVADSQLTAGAFDPNVAENTDIVINRTDYRTNRNVAGFNTDATIETQCPAAGKEPGDPVDLFSIDPEGCKCDPEVCAFPDEVVIEQTGRIRQAGGEVEGDRPNRLGVKGG